MPIVRKAPAAKPAAAKGDEAKTPKGFVHVFPTHKRQAGPLVVGMPAVDGNSDELVIDDDGADVPESLAQHLIAGGEATTKQPKADADAEA